MYNYSDKFREAVYSDKARFKIIANIELASGHTLLITEAHILQGTFSVESATSGSGEFSVGAAVASKLTFALNNNDDIYSSYDFIDAKISLSIGAHLPDDTIEFENYGVYTIAEANSSVNAITITALDNISKFSYQYGGEFVLPMTLEQIVIQCCIACGVAIDADSVPSEMKTYTVNSLNASNSLTYVGLISYASQIAGCFAKADHNGRLSFGWYDTSLLQPNYDGGTFEYNGRTYDDKPEAELDGGTFNYNDGDHVDGGSFNDFDALHYITTHISADIATDDIQITGIKVVAQATDSESEPETSLIGISGYVIEINSNPLINVGQTYEVAQQIFNRIGGMYFRPLNASILPDPAIEAGDVAFFAGKNDTVYPIFISSYKLCLDNSCTISCDAQSKNRHSITNQNAVTVAIEEAKKLILYEKSAREVELENMVNLMSNALGYHATNIETESGGIITYIHNKLNLDDSSTRWRFTELGFMVSTDYGKTWRAGFDASGNAVVNVLSAVGINADWINAGTITGRRINNGNGTFLVDENGNLTAKSAKITGGLIDLSAESESAALLSIKFNNIISQLSALQLYLSSTNGKTNVMAGGIQLVNEEKGSLFIKPSSIDFQSKGDIKFYVNSPLEFSLMDLVNGKANKSDLPDVRNFATKSDLNNIDDQIRNLRPSGIHFAASSPIYAGESVYDAIKDLNSRLKKLGG